MTDSDAWRHMSYDCCGDGRTIGDSFNAGLRNALRFTHEHLDNVFADSRSRSWLLLSVIAVISLLLTRWFTHRRMLLHRDAEKADPVSSSDNDVYHMTYVKRKRIVSQLLADRAPETQEVIRNEGKGDAGKYDDFRRLSADLYRGVKWQTRRKMLTPAFHFNILNQFVDIFIKEGDCMTKSLKDVGGTVVKDLLPFIRAQDGEWVVPTVAGACAAVTAPVT
ncbi:Cytochrome P450 4c3 [Camponotus floridanus]|uniref:Cytochrome P450 4c3 n=1 Tax=Camponotus floridanus TaxID=104421 RepID=E2A1Z7_CAMFO|nr:Cytochrome P450 4c3 [Camponotus floridanus]